MTSPYMYELFTKRIDKDVSGNINVATFLKLVNAEQQNYFLDAIGDQRQYKQNYGAAVRAPELSTRMINMLSPFLVPPFYVPLTNRVGTYNAGGFQNGDFAFGPYVWVSNYINPKCGEVALPASEWELPLLTQQEWRTRSDESRYDGASLDFPIFRVLDDSRIEVRPSSIKSVWVSYYRKPKAITLPTTIIDNVQYPDLNAARQDPEWHDLDCNAILDRVVGAAGLREQLDRWQAAGERSKQQ